MSSETRQLKTDKFDRETNGGWARVKLAVHLHTPNRQIAEFNMGAYEYALTRRVTIATHVKFSD